MSDFQQHHPIILMITFSIYGKSFDRTLDLNMVNLVPCSLHFPRTSCAPTSEMDFGAIFDTNLTLVPHVSAVCRSARYHIRNTGKIRRFLDRDSCEKLVHAFVTSRLDLNDGLPSGLTWDAISKLQLVQNMAARVVSRTRINEHITPVLMGLHWLPVQQRMQYKILLLAYTRRRQHELAPIFLQQGARSRLVPSR